MTVIGQPDKPAPVAGSGIADCCDASAMADLASEVFGVQQIDPATITISDPTAFVATDDDGADHLHLLVENLHCAACIGKIEGYLKSQTAVVSARVNMSTRRLSVSWAHGKADPAELMRGVAALGYPVAPFDPADVAKSTDLEEKRLLSALAVAGFAAGNVMLLSVSIWSGHAGGMGEGTRTLFHWISALIALPAVAYAGQPFFKSAFTALRAGTTNMDVPISLAVILASAMSIQQTMQNAQHAYFDASITLLFFLLVGRYLDRRARAKARSAATHLLGLQAQAATVIDPDGGYRSVRISDIKPGMTVLATQGERIPIDGEVITGISDIDTALVTGETLPKLASPGTAVFAGTMNLSAPITIRATVVADRTLLSEIVRLMELAEQGRAKFVRLADRVARIYAPVVHILAAITFVGWFLLTDVGWEPSMLAAIAVLIITCPCALGLAVPVVQVVASGRLLRSGVLVKSGDALERLANVDTVVFDKTGTLTLGQPMLSGGSYTDVDLSLAASMADHSKHPLSRAISMAAGKNGRQSLLDVREVPGHGIEAMLGNDRVRLGKREWCGISASPAWNGGSELWLTVGQDRSASFHLTDTVRSNVKDVIDALRSMKINVELLSGDTPEAVAPLAQSLGIENWQASCLPAAKTKRLSELADNGHTVMMVGDGLNDAPSLVAAHVSMSPAGAADISQTAADLIFQGSSLAPVLSAIRIARQSTSLVKQNFGLAFAYNAIAVPIAVLGLVTPLVAAIAMSTSSIIVTINALRLRLVK